MKEGCDSSDEKIDPNMSTNKLYSLPINKRRVIKGYELSYFGVINHLFVNQTWVYKAGKGAL